MESMDELRCYLVQERLSITVVKTVLEEARIYDKRKVQRIIESWIGTGNG